MIALLAFGVLLLLLILIIAYRCLWRLFGIEYRLEEIRDELKKNGGS